MIVTVTMNPAIDKTVEIDALQHGGLNRIKRVEYDAGERASTYPRPSGNWEEARWQPDFSAEITDAQSQMY